MRQITDWITVDSVAYEEMSCYSIYKVITLCPGAQPSIAIFAKTANLNRIVKDLGGAMGCIPLNGQ